MSEGGIPEIWRAWGHMLMTITTSDGVSGRIGALEQCTGADTGK